jgi:hypothetical protein
MRILLCVLLSATMLQSVVARGDGLAKAATNARVKKAIKCSFPKTKKRAPDWVCSASAEGLAVAAVGSADKSQAGISFMEQMAAADARVQLVRAVRVSVRRRVLADASSSGKEQDGLDGALMTTVTNDTLRGAKVRKSVYGPGGRLYVLMGLDEANANLLIESVTAEYLKQQHQ